MISVALQTMPMDVLTDGGSSAGVLVLVDGKLAAVLIQIDGEQSGSDDGTGGWFLEAGFGPCGRLLSRQPDVFATEAAALGWIEARLSHPLR